MCSIEYIYIILIVLLILSYNNKKSCGCDEEQYSYFIPRRREPTTIYWFYRPDCGYCKKMEKSWDSFASSIKLLKKVNIKTKKININDSNNVEMIRKFNVEYVPHIVKVRDDKKIIYEGDRSTRSLMAWAIKN